MIPAPHAGLTERVHYRSLDELTGLGRKLIDKIRHHYGDTATDQDILDKIQLNPYTLLEVPGIGFKRADAIALTDYGMSEDAPIRHKHGNREALRYDGSLDPRDYRRKRLQLGLRNPTLEFEGVRVDSGRVWLPEELEAEHTISRFVTEALAQPGFHARVFTPEQKAILAEDGLNDDQRAAVLAGLSCNPLLVLTGSAGTGKTTTLASLAKCALQEGKLTHVMAFAGKAAQRAHEAMTEKGASITCTTIHRGLGHNGRYFTADELDADLVVLDEASMIPNTLLAEVIQRLKPGATLLLVGDNAQLPPIGYGFPFADIITAGIPQIELTQNYRQAGQAAIFTLAEQIKTSGDRPDQGWIDFNSGVSLRTGLTDEQLDTYSQQAVKACRDLPLDRWQVVTFTNANREMLNIELQAMFNPSGQYVWDYPAWSLGKDKRNQWTFTDVRVGDKVMVKANNYDYEIFNGQTSILTAAERDERTGEKTVTLDLGERQVVLPQIDAEELLILGYAVTTHKAQGSGWHTVIVFQPEPVAFLPKRWWYTSVSRAEEQLHIFSQLNLNQWWRNATTSEQLPPSTLLKRIRNHQAR